MSLKSLYFIYCGLLIFVVITTFPDGFEAILLTAAVSIPLIFIFKGKCEKYSEHILKIFLVALILRTLASTLIFTFDLTNFFALDWNLYDRLGKEIADYLSGAGPMTPAIKQRVFSFQGTAWGISLLTGIIYVFVGKNILAVQLFIVVIGAATAPLTYLCTYQIYKNQRTALFAGYTVALMPSMILWSSLVLKDGIIIFFLILAVYASLKLQESFSYLMVGILILSLGGVMSMRYFIFYMAAVAIFGSFIIGQKNTVNSILTRAAVVVIVGIGLGYLGILNNAQFELQQMTSLENIQISRSDLAKSAASGFGEEYDVSTVGGAIAVLPVGFTYLIFSPLPWQITSSLSLMTMPEMIVWWLMLPFAVTGIIYSFKHKLRKCISILVFTLMLTISYSILQGNVGTAYRQRAQIQVFIIIFIGVGINLWKEKQENLEILRREKRREVEQRIIKRNLTGKL